jgi:signal peptidase II
MKLLLVILLFFFDFISKKIVFNFIELNNSISVTFFFDIIHIHNYGISFGLFAGYLHSNFIIALGIIIIIFLIFWILKSVNIIEKWGFLLVISGAISNIVDRIFNNYVLDFIYFNYKNYYWPAFNFADIYISVGLLLILYQTYKSLKFNIKEKND